MSYGCPPGAPCPYLGPPCLGFSMLDVETGNALKTIRPPCTPGRNTLNSTTFTNMLDDSAKGQALLVGSDQKVTAVSSQSGAVLRTYQLACCTNDYSQNPDTLLDQHDQLLLTTAESGVAGVSDKLVAQNAITGQFKYQAALEGTDALRFTLLSSVTGWLYFWTQCVADSNTICIEVYQASSGKKVSTWQANSHQTPLAADPTENLLYVRQDQPNAQSETLVIDGHSGKTVIVRQRRRRWHSTRRCITLICWMMMA